MRYLMLKRHILILAIWIAVLVFFNLSGAQCPEDPNDLGVCDTIYFETFDCDHVYQAEPGSFDSVRVAVYVTHDANIIPGSSPPTEDSIAAIVAPLFFWHQPPGCADSVILPYWDNWNNIAIDPDDPTMSRSMFRHIVDEHTGDTVYNRLLQMVENGKTAWSVYYDFESHSCDGDSGRCGFSVVPMTGTCQRWWEGSRVLLTTLTFHVYMSEDCDTTEIDLDVFWWPMGLTFTRHDAVLYIPQHNLPVCDTIYIDIICGDCNRDGIINVADVVCLINYLFLDEPPPDPLCIGDVNCDGEVNIADAVYLINYLFIGGPPPCAECCHLKAKMKEFPGQKMERDLPQIRPVPQKLPKAPGGLKRME